MSSQRASRCMSVKRRYSINVAHIGLSHHKSRRHGSDQQCITPPQHTRQPSPKADSLPRNRVIIVQQSGNPNPTCLAHSLTQRVGSEVDAIFNIKRFHPHTPQPHSRSSLQAQNNTHSHTQSYLNLKNPPSGPKLPPHTPVSSSRCGDNVRMLTKHFTW
jgi:hypothetical protein